MRGGGGCLRRLAAGLVADLWGKAINSVVLASEPSRGPCCPTPSVDVPSYQRMKASVRTSRTDQSVCLQDGFPEFTLVLTCQSPLRESYPHTRQKPLQAGVSSSAPGWEVANLLRTLRILRERRHKRSQIEWAATTKCGERLFHPQPVLLFALYNPGL